MILVEAGLRTALLGGPFWRILLAGFEAGTVGGLADWFAVTALFHEVPLPFIRRHTNIIIRNRERLTEGAVDLVANKWLSPDAVRDKLAGLSVSTFILEWLREEGNRERVLRAGRELFARVADGLDSPCRDRLPGAHPEGAGPGGGPGPAAGAMAGRGIPARGPHEALDRAFQRFAPGGE